MGGYLKKDHPYYSSVEDGEVECGSDSGIVKSGVIGSTGIEIVDYNSLSREARLRISADLCDNIREPLINFLTGVLDGSLEPNTMQFLAGMYLVELVFKDAGIGVDGGSRGRMEFYEEWLAEISETRTGSTKRVKHTKRRGK